MRAMNRRPLTTAVLALTLTTGTALAACGGGNDAGQRNDDGGAVTSQETRPREDTPPPREDATPPREEPSPKPPREPPPKPSPETSPPNEPAPQGEREEREEEAESQPPEPPVTDGRSTVVERIVDGDTIEVSGDGQILPRDSSLRVRLLAIDAPEEGTCYSDEATARLEQLLPVGSTVRIERDKDLKDRYDRYLLYVWNEQGEFVNESLARTGHAEAVLFEPNDKHWPTISQAGDAAELNDSGLWSTCAPETDTPTPPDTPPPADTPPPTDIPEPAAPEGAYPPGPPPGPDLDCSDIQGPVMVGSDDPHRLDRDGDGIGCE
ncbi:thermonuclease family protein [Streptomyces sp. NPDC002994]|uniref:thermonuclease family protein n=1 Tax=Streptomyces sp. NPDC002994 TaxID=3154441 RepID=UPI0033BFA9DC